MFSSTDFVVFHFFTLKPMVHLELFQCEEGRKSRFAYEQQSKMIRAKF